MPVYPPEIADAIREPKFSRTIDDANAAGAEAKFDCGCFFRIEMRIDGDDSTIREIGYQSNGCGYMIAAAESAAADLLGRSLRDLHGEVEINSSSGRPECSVAVSRAITNAFADHRSRRLEEFRGEKALICTCFGVTEEAIEHFVNAHHPVDVSEVSAAIRAGSGCGSCRMLIQEIIDAND